MRPTLHFLGGVSGAGKSTLLSQAAEAGVSFQRVSGGQLIGTAMRATGAYSRPDVKDADNAARNQALMLQGLEQHLQLADEHVPLVLDGHFVVPSRAGLIPVDAEVFRTMAPTSLLLLRATPSEVAFSLRQRPAPAEWWDGNLTTIERFCDDEERVARSVARVLKLPLTIFGRAAARATLIHALRVSKDASTR